jgi:hypothetical protein
MYSPIYRYEYPESGLIFMLARVGVGHETIATFHPASGKNTCAAVNTPIYKKTRGSPQIVGHPCWPSLDKEKEKKIGRERKPRFQTKDNLFTNAPNHAR